MTKTILTHEFDPNRDRQALAYLLEEVRRIVRVHGRDYMGIPHKPLEMACAYAERIARNAR
jgi:hypothetical protein